MKIIVDKKEVDLEDVEIAKKHHKLLLALSAAGQLTSEILETFRNAPTGSSKKFSYVLFKSRRQIPENWAGVVLLHSDGSVGARSAKDLENIGRHLVLPKKQLPVKK